MNLTKKCWYRSPEILTTRVTHCFTKGIKEYLVRHFHKVDVTRKKNIDLLNDPLINKTCAFPFKERDRLELRGLLPPAVLSLEHQAELYMEEYKLGLLEIAAAHPDDETLKSGVTPNMIRKWKVLQNLQDRDETLFYYLLMNNIEEMAPIVYTPTVGWLCKNYSKMFRRPRGLFITAEDKGDLTSLIYNWPHDEVKAIVVTDGSRILGLGDLGIGGLGISVGKLDLYVGAGGFHPRSVLPVVIDVGTNNEELLNDPYYMGLKRNRLEGDAYYDLIDEFMAAALYRWPNVLIQFEDFQLKHALNLLFKYRDELLVFNDDIQGTAAIVLAGIIGALKVQGLENREFANQKFVIAGAGSAGMGVVYKLHLFLQRYGISPAQALKNFYILDKDGLITKTRSDLSSRVRPFARSETDMEGLSLLEVVKAVKPSCLIGLSGVGGIFSKEVLEQMTDQPDGRMPIIFPLSNPTSKAECSAAEAQKHTGYKAIFGSGSPFKDVFYNNEKIRSNQANNVYIYPGLALGASLGETGVISDSMIIVSAEALSELLTDEDVKARAIYPRLYTIRDASVHIAARVMQQAYRENRLNNKAAQRELEKGFDELKEYVKAKQWTPQYRPLVYLGPGENE